MATLPELESALRKADAAGNVEDARAFASAIRQMRAEVSRGADPRFADVRSAQGYSDQPPPTPEPRSFTDIESRARGLTGRTLAQGVAGLVDLGIETQPHNLIRRAVSGIPGLEGVAPQPRVRETVERGLTERGVPTFDTPAERVLGGVGEAATGAALTGGVAGLPRAGLQTASAALGSVAGGVAREAGGTPRQQLAASVAGGLLPGAALGRGASRLSPADRATVQAAEQRRIPIRPAGVSDSRVTQTLRSVPGAGARGRYESDVGAFNKALAESVGVKAPVLTKAENAAKQAADKQLFNTLASKNDLVVDAKFVTQMNNILNSAKVSAAAERAVRVHLDNLMNNSVVTPAGVRIPGRAYASIYSELGNASKAAKPYLQNMREAMLTQMEKSLSPADAKAWAKLRQEYGDRKALQKLVVKAGDRPLDPRDLMGAVNTKAYNSQTRMAEGRRGELGTLADIGQRIVLPTPANLPVVGAGGLGLVGAGLTGNIPLAAAGYGLLNALGRRADRRVLAVGNRLSTLGTGAVGAAQGAEQTRRDRKKKKGDRK